LAEADGTVGPGVGATWDGETLTLLSRRADGKSFRASNVGEFDDIVADAAAQRAGSVAVRIDFEIGAADPGTCVRRPDPSLAAGFSAREPIGQVEVDILVAGAGVVRAGLVGELANLAEDNQLGVLNTFTAKGLFTWDSPYHLGTAFLQERDLELAGIGPHSRVLMIGVDADECAPALLARAGVRIGPEASVWSVPATELPKLANWVRSAHGRPPEPGELYRVLASIVQPMYDRAGLPFAPPRAAVELMRSLPADGAVTVEPGLTGMWLARAIPTTRLGSVRVPAAGRAGSAVAAALNLALDGRPALAVVDAPISAASLELMELARSRDLSFVVAEWGQDGDHRTAGSYGNAVSAAFSTGGVHLIRMPVDLTLTTLLTDAAGPLVAWSEGQPYSTKPSDRTGAS
jgi:thiamine pyrophosphate-dependent acetolactate synthase large subunit-like protein